MEEQEVHDMLIAIRPYLVDLVGADAATILDGRIDRLLADRPVKRPALELLSEHPATRSWAAEYLRTPVQLRLYEAVPGSPQKAPRVPKYVCPVPGCPTVWFRFSIAEAVPGCPLHNNVGLVPAAGT